MNQVILTLEHGTPTNLMDPIDNLATNPATTTVNATFPTNVPAADPSRSARLTAPSVQTVGNLRAQGMQRVPTPACRSPSVTRTQPQSIISSR